MEAPKRIYLQTGYTEWDKDEPWPTDGVTWCVDRINDSDVEYVRRDVAARLRAMLDMAMHAHIMDDEQIDEADDFLDETAWLEDSPEAGGEESEM